MREENVTKTIIQCLILAKWTIVTFDFPQSGTGIILHPDEITNEKNKGSIIPDIIAVKNSICLFFENKNRTVKSDFTKVSGVRDNKIYLKSITSLLKDYTIEQIYYGIGLPSEKYGKRSQSLAHMVDFVVGVTNSYNIEWLWNPHGICE
ncbi:MAG: hypothetical protein WCR95_03540 [Eubacteriales bacterium]